MRFLTAKLKRFFRGLCWWREKAPTHGPSGVEEPGVSGGSLPEQGNDCIRVLLGLVDILDDLERMSSHVDGPSEDALDFLRDKLEQLIAVHGGEIIRRDTWTPELQRAIARECAGPGQPENEIIRTGSSGLRMGDKLIRKQEVVLARGEELP